MPEIADGIVEIKACAREPGHRTKIAVWSNDHNVDPVGACVGARGGRVRMVVNELRGEKIDIVPFSEDFADFVAKALSPAKVSQVIVSDDGTQADVIVPDHQLSLAIGREGQNARLAARLTGVRIDIRSETQLAEGVPARRDELEDGVEYAEGQWVANAETGEMEWHAADGTRDQRGRVERPGRRPRTPATPGGRRGAAERRDEATAVAGADADEAAPAVADADAEDAATEASARSRRAGRGAADDGADDSERAGCRSDSTASRSAHAWGAASVDRRRRSYAVCSRPTVGRPSTARVGRGAWLCVPPRTASRLAVRRKAFERAWRRPVGPARRLASSARCELGTWYVMTRKVE